jgi:hypothetical protein
MNGTHKLIRNEMSPIKATVFQADLEVNKIKIE